MKKHLIAAAVAAAVAAPAAMAQVTISGNLDTGYAQSKFKDDDGDSVKFTRTGNASAMSTSTIAFSGSEDLGGGLKASFFVNNSLNSSTGALGARDTWAALSGGFGQVKIGRFTPAAEVTTSAYAVTGTVNMPGSVDYIFGGSTYGGTPTIGTGSTADIFGGSGVPSGLAEIGRQGGNIEYTSPSINGFTVSLGYINTKGEGTATVDFPGSGTATLTAKSEIKQMDITANYSAGPLKIGVAVAQQDRNGTTATPNNRKDETDFNSIGASYDFGAALLKAAYISRKDEEGGAQVDKTKLYAVGVTVPMGATSLFANYVDGTLKGDGSAGDKADHKGYQVGAVYTLSKRTNVYAIIGDDEFKGTGGKVTAEGFAIGLRHSF